MGGCECVCGGGGIITVGVADKYNTGYSKNQN